MKPIVRAGRMKPVHSDIRGPLFVEAMKRQKQGIDILKLNTGNPATFGFGLPDSIKNALMEHMQDGVGYCDFKGMPQARQAICDYETSKGIKGITPDDVFIGNGVSEVVSFALTPLLNDGDEVLVPSPSYSLWGNSVYLEDGKPVFYTCDEQANWYPDIQDIRSKITDKTKAIVIINPNNPTGVLYPKELLLEIIQIARESHCLCGYRCGWMVISGPRELTEDYRQGIIQLTSLRLCANTMAQIVIPAALDDMDTPASMVRPGGRIYEQREATVRELEKIDGLSFVKNDAAFYVFPKLDVKKFNITNDKQFAHDLLDVTNILLVPGSGFDWKDPDHFRIVMLPQADILSDAIRRMGTFLDGYKQK